MFRRIGIVGAMLAACLLWAPSAALAGDRGRAPRRAGSDKEWRKQQKELRKEDKEREKDRRKAWRTWQKEQREAAREQRRPLRRALPYSR